MKNNTIIQVILILLFLNNLIGIILNFELTIVSICCVLGIPVVLGFLVNIYWLIKFKKSEYLVIHFIFFSFFLISYNFFVYKITIENSLSYFNSFYPFVFPFINSILYLLLMFASIFYIYQLKKKLNAL